MAKQLVEIDILDGWEFVRFGGVAEGEWFIDESDEYPRQATREIATLHIVIKKVVPWEPPAFLKPGWIAMDANGTWWWYEYEEGEEPTRGLCSWEFEGNNMDGLENFNWTPPQCDDWRKSKRRIP